ncbi:MAG: lipoprotein-releasing system ATP-binding protein [Actinomycetota bacterium]
MTTAATPTPDAPVVAGKVVRLSPLVRRLTCPNPSVFTGPGTNTYLIGDPASGHVVVLDPGPDDLAHIRRIARTGPRRAIKTIVVTHTHPDHAPGVAPLKALTGAEVVGFDSRDELTTDVDARDGYVVEHGDFTLRAVHTPGHASNHLCWLLEEENLLFSGDHVMAGSTVVISPPDGDMRLYLDSLARVRRMKVAAIAPAHGPLLTDPDTVIAGYIAHREAREQLVANALATRRTASIQALVRDVYTDVPEDRYPIAQFSLWAHLRKMRADGLAKSARPDDITASWSPTRRLRGANKTAKQLGTKAVARIASPAMSPIVDARGVNKVYRTGAVEVPALHSVNLSIEPGDFVAVMGPSGSGKTTLLNCLSGLDDIDDGDVFIDGSNIHEMADGARTEHRAGRMGFIFQSFNLIPVLSAVENVELPLLLSGVKSSEARSRSMAMLERVGLAHRPKHKPNELSGGEQQRVAVARALVTNPAIVWADEPTGNLDSHMAIAVLDLLQEVNDAGQTILVVTHDDGIAARARRLVRMADGRIVADGDTRSLLGNDDGVAAPGTRTRTVRKKAPAAKKAR